MIDDRMKLPGFDRLDERLHLNSCLVMGRCGRAARLCSGAIPCASLSQTMPSQAIAPASVIDRG